MARKVTAPDGRQWKVHRRWVPWRVKLRKDWDGFDSWGDLGGFDDAAGFFFAIGLVIVLFAALLLVWPIVALAVEVVIVVLGLLVGLLGRVVLRRPWTVEATARGEPRRTHSWKVVGWRASGRAIDAAADALEQGTELPAGAGGRTADRVLVG